MQEEDSSIYILENLDCICGVVAISYYGRSGSFLLSSLFDGHPEVLSVPPHALIDFLQQFSLFDITKNPNIEDIVDYVVASFPLLFCETERTGILHLYGDNRDESCGVPRQAFRQYLNISLTGMAKKSIGANDFYGLIFKAIHAAYLCASGRKIGTRKPLIMYQSHDSSAVTISTLNKLLGTVRFITCIRNPIKTFDSHLSHHIVENPTPPLRNLFALLLGILHSGGVCTGSIERERFLAVRFEDMHAEPEALMRSLCRWLGIEYHPCLLQSTVDGKTYWFPTAGGEYRQGTNPKAAANLGTSILSPLDRIMMRRTLRDYFLQWGYAQNRRESVAIDVVARKFLIHLPPKIMLKLFIADLASDLRSGQFGQLGETLKAHMIEWGRIRILYRNKFDCRDAGEDILPLLDLSASPD